MVDACCSLVVDRSLFVVCCLSRGCLLELLVVFCLLRFFFLVLFDAWCVFVVVFFVRVLFVV